MGRFLEGQKQNNRKRGTSLTSFIPPSLPALCVEGEGLAVGRGGLLLLIICTAQQHGEVSCRHAAPPARPGGSAASNALAGFFDRQRECRREREGGKPSTQLERRGSEREAAESQRVGGNARHSGILARRSTKAFDKTSTSSCTPSRQHPLLMGRNQAEQPAAVADQPVWFSRRGGEESG